MLVEQLITDLQNLTSQRITQKDLGDALGISKQAIGNKKADNYQFEEYEINKIKNYILSKYKNSECTLIDNADSVTMDYYPDVFGSCGTGYFVSSEVKEQIKVPVNSFIKHLAPGKKYSVINAKGDSMQPFIHSGDKLVVEHYEGQQIIDNQVYVFCYENEIFVKRLVKNINQLVIKSDNTMYDVIKLVGEELNKVIIIGQIVGLMRDMR